MKPRASIPTTLSTARDPSGSRPAAASASTTSEKPAWSARSGEMSLNTTPGFGKSGTSRTRVVSAWRARLPGRGVGHRLPRLLRDWRVGWARLLAALFIGRADLRGAAGRAAAVRAAGGRPPRLPRGLLLGLFGPRPARVASAVSPTTIRPVAPRRALHPLRLGDHRRLTHLELGQHRRRDEDRGVRPCRHADEQREREVLQWSGAELEGSDVEDRADRQQRRDRRVDRPDQGLVDREVCALRVGTPGGRRDALACSRAPCRTPRRCRTARTRGS